MPQLLWGAGDPLAITIEASALAYFAMFPPSVLQGQGAMNRLYILGGLYFIYNMFVVPHPGNTVPVKPE